ncbi:hypothetical protein J6590_009679 [Homalodisca vitripennis]|nr:hypothetical protein J6590_009679 [Homalodisca vitripennis]
MYVQNVLVFGPRRIRPGYARCATTLTVTAGHGLLTDDGLRDHHSRVVYPSSCSGGCNRPERGVDNSSRKSQFVT